MKKMECLPKLKYQRKHSLFSKVKVIVSGTVAARVVVLIVCLSQESRGSRGAMAFS